MQHFFYAQAIARVVLVNLQAAVTAFDAAHALGLALRRTRIFARSSFVGSAICRWVVDDLTVDVMPVDASVLGFSNRWYADGVAYAETVELASDLSVRVFTAPYFLASKLEAFKDRGKGDFLASADLEDVITVVDGRASIVEEVEASQPDVRAYLADEFQRLLANRDFVDALPGLVQQDAASRRRLPTLRQRLIALAVGVTVPRTTLQPRRLGPLRHILGNAHLPRIRRTVSPTFPPHLPAIPHRARRAKHRALAAT